MQWSSFIIIFIICAGSIFVFRVAPMLLLAGRELPTGLSRALDYIPVAAFAALVANDLLMPATILVDPWAAVLPLIAAVPVVLVAIKTHSLALCIVVGVAAYALLALI